MSDTEQARYSFGVRFSESLNHMAIGDGVAFPPSIAHPDPTEPMDENADLSSDSLETIEWDDGKDE